MIGVLLILATQSPDWSNLSSQQTYILEQRICGPNGTTDWDENGPVCDREGWNGYDYTKVSDEDFRLHGWDEFLCDDAPELFPERCGLKQWAK